jgi:adenylate cyclase
MSQRRKLTAILAADVAGYSRLMADDEGATLRSLNDARALFRKRIEAHGGRLIDTAGDSILTEFPSAVEAVECAVEIQHELARGNRQFAEHRRMQFRIGINLGDVIEQEDGTIYGDGVNVAARLQQLAEPGGICISGTAFDQVEGKLPLQFKFVGEHQVKNITKPVRVFRVLIDAPAGKSQPALRARRRALSVGVAALIAVMVAVGVVWKLQKPPGIQATTSNDPALAMPTGPAIAVLPFTNMSGDSKQDFFADGIAEEVLTGLSRFPNLRVLGRNSTFQYKGRPVEVRQIGHELRADYVLEGSVRKAGETVRVSAQLLDTSTGGHLWAETFERELTPQNLFAVQDEITSKVVTRIGDIHGVITRAYVQKLRTRSPDNLADYECVLLAYEYLRFLTPGKHATVKACLTRTVERSPDYAEAWAHMAYIYTDQYWTDFEGPPNPLDRALSAARRAVQLDPASAIAHYTLANVYFFKNDLELFFSEADKALALNPNNTEIVAALGLRITYTKQRKRGIALIKKAIALNPSHPGWYWFPLVYDYYQNGDYEKALQTARQGNMPGFWYWHYHLAICYGQLGQKSQARAALDDLRKLNPKFEKEPLRYMRQWYKSEEALQHLANGLRKAGLAIPDAKI